MLFVKSVDKIVEKFDKMIAELVNTVEYHNEKQESLAEVIELAREEQKKHNKEATRALVIKAKIESLIK